VSLPKEGEGIWTWGRGSGMQPPSLVLLLPLLLLPLLYFPIVMTRGEAWWGDGGGISLRRMSDGVGKRA
jgi:hypothetical protein